MKTVLGMDIGGSTTKIVCRIGDKTLFSQCPSADPLRSLDAAFDRFRTENGIALSDIEQVVLTGVGASFVENFHGLPIKKANEFLCIAKGGLALSGLSEAIVVSLGTGTAVVHAKADSAPQYLGGTGIGGGTLAGLGKLLLHMEIEELLRTAEEGDLQKVDLHVGDMTGEQDPLALASNLTAANFGKLSENAAEEDIALGLLNMVCEAAATLGIFAAHEKGLSHIVLTGTLTSVPTVGKIFENLGGIFGLEFIIPENARYAAAIGAMSL